MKGCVMLLIPIQTNAGIYDLFIVLLEDNIRYLRKGNVEPVNPDTMPGIGAMKMDKAWICYATHTEVQHIMSLSAGDPMELIKFLLRGLKQDPPNPAGQPQMPILN